MAQPAPGVLFQGLGGGGLSIHFKPQVPLDLCIFTSGVRSPNSRGLYGGGGGLIGPLLSPPSTRGGGVGGGGGVGCGSEAKRSWCPEHRPQAWSPFERWRFPAEGHVSAKAVMSPPPRGTIDRCRSTPAVNLFGTGSTADRDWVVALEEAGKTRRYTPPSLPPEVPRIVGTTLTTPVAPPQASHIDGHRLHHHEFLMHPVSETMIILEFFGKKFSKNSKKLQKYDPDRRSCAPRSGPWLWRGINPFLCGIQTESSERLAHVVGGNDCVPSVTWSQKGPANSDKPPPPPVQNTGVRERQQTGAAGQTRPPPPARPFPPPPQGAPPPPPHSGRTGHGTGVVPLPGAVGCAVEDEGEGSRRAALRESRGTRGPCGAWPQTRIRTKNMEGAPTPPSRVPPPLPLFQCKWKPESGAGKIF